MVTKHDMQSAMERLGVKPGDSLIVHSSFKSLGALENGADTVVSGIQAALGENGTLMFPTLCQNDWEHVYENWHPDAPSDVGYLTNYFRKLPGALRSNQATHSVAAIGRDAVYFTETHGVTGLRHGIFGDTCFSADSPWEKMYERNTKVLFIGCSIHNCTLRHLAEYQHMEECLHRAEKSPQYEDLYTRVWCYERWNERGAWWHIRSEYIRDLLEEQGKLHSTQCGDASLLLVSTRDFVDEAHRIMQQRDQRGFYIGSGVYPKDVQDTLEWMAEIDRL